MWRTASTSQVISDQDSNFPMTTVSESSSTLPTYQASQFFTAESARLSSLLDVVAAGAASSRDPQSCNRYLEVTNIVSELLSQAQYYNCLAPEELKGRWLEIQLFAGRSQAVKDAVAAMELTFTSTATNAGCKKRARSGTLGVENASVLKRSRSYQNAEEMQVDVVMTDLPIRTAAPRI